MVPGSLPLLVASSCALLPPLLAQVGTTKAAEVGEPGATPTATPGVLTLVVVGLEADSGDVGGLGVTDGSIDGSTDGLIVGSTDGSIDGIVIIELLLGRGATPLITPGVVVLTLVVSVVELVGEVGRTVGAVVLLFVLGIVPLTETILSSSPVSLVPDANGTIRLGRRR